MTRKSRSSTTLIRWVLNTISYNLDLTPSSCFDTLYLVHQLFPRKQTLSPEALLFHQICITYRNKKFELMLTWRAKAYSSSCSQIQTVSPAISKRLLQGYRSLMPSCAGFLEPIKLRLGPSNSMFSAENFIRSFSMSISIGFCAIRSCNVSCSPKSSKKIYKTSYFGVQGHSRSLNSVAIESQCTTSY